MEMSVGGHATEASQMCHEGRNRGNVTALEAVYDEWRLYYARPNWNARL